jgi:GPH family glycoside/pentoside/hexuronide:cation symporter
MCSERIKHSKQNREKSNYFRTLKSFFANRTMLAVSLTTMTSLIFMLSFMSTNLLVFQTYYRNGNLASLNMVVMLPALLIVPLVKPLVKRFGKRSLCSWPLLAGGAAYLVLFLLPQVPLVLFIALQTLAALSMGIYSKIDWALVADGIDSMELQTGRRQEGTVVATYTMLRKIAQGINQALIPILIAIIIPGLNMNDAQTWSAEYGLQIKNITAVLCSIGFFMAFIFMHFIYDIDKKREKELPILLGRVKAEMETGS